MPRALIVDDSRYQRHLIFQVIQGQFTADEAANGQEALDLFKAALEAGNPYDLVVMDILMPVLSGHDSLAGIRRLEDAAGMSGERRTPAIMLSSLDDPVNMMRAQYESGAQAYVTKPFTPKTLLEALASLELMENPLSAEENEDACKTF
jgi:two-component system, chemotaxis family, chemotaxis protein CheY